MRLQHKLSSLLMMSLLLTGLVSCKKWLDVKPKTEVDAAYNFTTEQGFKDALTGVYLQLTSESLYGRELSFGFVDVLGKQYTQFSTGHPYEQDAKYNYQFAATKARIDAIWLNMYQAVANVNNIIGYLNKTSPSIFTNKNYNIIKGEAYALRAMMHFDLLRLFAPAPASPGGMDSVGIPYVKNFNTLTTKAVKVKQALADVAADLDTAAALLKVDPIIPGSTATDPTNYLRDRPYKFNYYAVKALQARMYLYQGDKVKALAAAKEVMNTTAFSWVPDVEVAGQSPNTRNRVFTEELIFTLNMSNLAQLAVNWFTPANFPLTRTSDEFAADYEYNSADYRFTYLLDDYGGPVFPAKLSQPAGIPIIFSNRLPLIRLSEMYYIAAECELDNNIPNAVQDLNTVREARNIFMPLSTGLSKEDVQNELLKEYRKEFLCEGQLFFYYKRLNAANIQYAQATGSNAIYVLPVPDAELEYGGR